MIEVTIMTIDELGFVLETRDSQQCGQLLMEDESKSGGCFIYFYTTGCCLLSFDADLTDWTGYNN